jgi:TonB family protein
MQAYGTCSNVDRCGKAARAELIEVYPGFGQICPECGRKLTPTDARPPDDPAPVAPAPLAEAVPAAAEPPVAVQPAAPEAAEAGPEPEPPPLPPPPARRSPSPAGRNLIFVAIAVAVMAGVAALVLQPSRQQGGATAAAGSLTPAAATAQPLVRPFNPSPARATPGQPRLAAVAPPATPTPAPSATPAVTPVSLKPQTPSPSPRPTLRPKPSVRPAAVAAAPTPRPPLPPPLVRNVAVAPQTAPAAGPTPEPIATAAPTPVPRPACANPNVDARILGRVIPEYPDSVRQLGIAGTAEIRVSLAANGAVQATSVVRSSGNGTLDQIAMRAARQSTYAGEIRNCERTPSSYLYIAEFSPN